MNDTMRDLELMVGNQEQILWQGKPDRKCFIFESIFNPMLPFALIWALVDFGILAGSFMAAAEDDANILVFIIPFLLLHMMPVWIYLGGLFTIARKYRNTNYIITDKGIYKSSGMFSLVTEMKPFTDLSHINIHRGIFDQWLGVGDVITVCGHGSSSGSRGGHGHSHNFSLEDLHDYQEVFQMVKNLQTDIYSDTMFPNDMRPEQNHGYQTSYVGKVSKVSANDYPSFGNSNDF